MRARRSCGMPRMVECRDERARDVGARNPVQRYEWKIVLGDLHRMPATGAIQQEGRANDGVIEPARAERLLGVATPDEGVPLKRFSRLALTDGVVTPMDVMYRNLPAKPPARAAASVLSMPSYSVARTSASRDGRALRTPAVKMMSRAPRTAGGSVSGLVMSPGMISTADPDASPLARDHGRGCERVGPLRPGVCAMSSPVPRVPPRIRIGGESRIRRKRSR